MNTWWYTLDPTKGRLAKIHAATVNKVKPNKDDGIAYLHLEFSGGFKDEGSPSQSGFPLCHQIDIPADKRIVGVYGHRRPNGEIYSLGFLLMPKMD